MPCLRRVFFRKVVLWYHTTIPTNDSKILRRYPGPRHAPDPHPQRPAPCPAHLCCPFCGGPWPFDPHRSGLLDLITGRHGRRQYPHQRAWDPQSGPRRGGAAMRPTLLDRALAYWERVSPASRDSAGPHARFSRWAWRHHAYPVGPVERKQPDRRLVEQWFRFSDPQHVGLLLLPAVKPIPAVSTPPSSRCWIWSHRPSSRPIRRNSFLPAMPTCCTAASSNARPLAAPIWASSVPRSVTSRRSPSPNGAAGRRSDRQNAAHRTPATSVLYRGPDAGAVQTRPPPGAAIP